MQIRYSKHLVLRIKMRGIPYELPRIVYMMARRHFRDVPSDLKIAAYRTEYSGKLRELALTYRAYPSHILLVTIHPLKPNQLENRIRSGRWEEIF